MEHIRTYLINLPTHVRGLTSIDDDGEPMIYLNSRLSSDQNRQTYDHEAKHIMQDDLHNSLPIEEVENMAESNDRRPADPLAHVYLRGFELYGIERSNPIWDKLFAVWAFWSHKDKYVGVVSKRVDGYSKAQIGQMVKDIFEV